MSDPTLEYILLDHSADSWPLSQQQIESSLSDLYPRQKINFIRHHSTSIKDLIIYLSLKNRYPNTDDYQVINEDEIEINHPIIFFINVNAFDQDHTDKSKLDSLSLQDLKSLIADFFHHLNLIIQIIDDNDKAIDIPKKEILVTESLLKYRMTRVLSWIGYNPLPNEEDVQYSAINSMVDDLSCCVISKDLKINFTDMLLNEIDYYQLLKLNHPKQYYIDMIYEWGFKSHLLTYDELLYCCECIFEISAENCGVDQMKNLIGDSNRLLGFFFNVRDNYRMGNQFHNFRHAVDVLQATFYLLVRLDCLPNKDENNTGVKFISKTLLPPCITLTLLIASFGHDIGHPGLTNKFLVDNKTPIARYFNDISVLESFHYAEFKSILDKFFPNFFAKVEGSEQIIEKSILSTDMINHFAYIEKIDDFIRFQKNVEESLTPNGDIIETRYLLCSLIIKCADISNVSRPLEVSAKWGVSLTNETNEIQFLESKIQSPSKDFTSNYQHNIVNLKTIQPDQVVAKLPSMCKGQCFFIKNFVMMFFKKIQLTLPELDFLYIQINENVKYWDSFD